MLGGWGGWTESHSALMTIHQCSNIWASGLPLSKMDLTTQEPGCSPGKRRESPKPAYLWNMACGKIRCAITSYMLKLLLKFACHRKEEIGLTRDAVLVDDL